MTPKAANGRFGDSVLVHAAPGELLVPGAMLVAFPEVREKARLAFDTVGLDIDRFIVGSEHNSINPVDGAPEFFLPVIAGVVASMAGAGALGTALAVGGATFAQGLIGGQDPGRAALSGLMAGGGSFIGSELFGSMSGGGTFGDLFPESLSNYAGGLENAAISGEELGFFDSALLKFQNAPLKSLTNGLLDFGSSGGTSTGKVQAPGITPMKFESLKMPELGGSSLQAGSNEAGTVSVPGSMQFPLSDNGALTGAVVDLSSKLKQYGDDVKKFVGQEEDDFNDLFRNVFDNAVAKYKPADIMSPAFGGM